MKTAYHLAIAALSFNLGAIPVLGVAIIDNTSANLSPYGSVIGTITIDIMPGVMPPTIQNFIHSISFESPSTETWELDAVTLALRSYQGTSPFEVRTRLYLANESNLPTGAALATMTVSLNLTTSSALYRMELSEGDWSLLPDTKYALAFDVSSPSESAYWGTGDPDVAYSAFEDFTYLSRSASSNYGSTWSGSSGNNLLKVEATLTAVPEPSEYALMAGLGLLGFAAFRRFRRSAV